MKKSHGGNLESANFMLMTTRIIGEKKDPYLTRFIIIQTPLFSIYVHKMHRSDYERALHDHPWAFLSLVLKPYAEHFYKSRKQPNYYIQHEMFDILYRPAKWKHRVVISEFIDYGLTLVLTGPRVRKWGFWPGGVWCHWKRFNEKLGICESAPIPGKNGLN